MTLLIMTDAGEADHSTNATDVLPEEFAYFVSPGLQLSSKLIGGA